ncbi:FAD-dependent monooxygenase [Streptomyces axinellae]|uniref:FAD-dependent monooxygenase n=1 Tax=Streptomyces axinellae TaxID=552788 RepID=UPI0031E2DD36
MCVVGGGPGGLALARALARLGREAVVVERRDPARSAGPAFRGESVSPDGVRLLDELGVLGGLRAAGAVHRVDRLEIQDAGRRVLDVRFADFPYAYRHPVEIAQPALRFALAAPVALPGRCTVLAPATAIALLGAGRTVTGVRASTPGGPVEITAALTVGADGRYSDVRRMAGLGVHARRTPLERDVIWLKLASPQGWDRRAYRVRISRGSHGLFLPSTDGTVRIGLNIPKGGLRALRSGGAGPAVLRDRLAELAPEAADVLSEGLRDWSDTVLLDIFTTRVARWWAPGVVLIGDAAHTLSPVLGQGVNHALADAVALAPLVADALENGAARPVGRTVPDGVLERFQRGRERDVARSRALQLRQERMFTLAAPAAAVVRRSVYRALNSSRTLQRRVLAPAYFPGQRPLPRAAAAAAAAAGVPLAAVPLAAVPEEGKPR